MAVFQSQLTKEVLMRDCGALERLRRYESLYRNPHTMKERYCRTEINYLNPKSGPEAVTDWNDRDAIESWHYDEVRDWAVQSTGCDAVLFFPGLQRNPEAAALHPDYAPIEFAHSDYTESYLEMIADPEHPYHRVLQPSMVRAGVNSEQMQSLQRVLTLQLWRNTGPALMDHPMAFCDARSVARDQLTPLRVERYGGVETQFDAFALLNTAALAHNRWYTFPEMSFDEVVVFRAFDSDCVASGAPFWTPHTAFRDPHSTGVPRRSIEMRAVCLFW